MRISILAPLVFGLSAGLAIAGCGGDATPPIRPPPPPEPPAQPAATSDTLESTPSPTPVAPKAKVEDLAIATIKGLVEAFAARDAKKVAERYTTDAVVTIYGEADVTGREAITTDTQKWIDGFGDLKLQVGRVVMKSDMAIVEWAFAGTHTGDYAGTKATQRPLGAVAVSVVWFNSEGLVAKEHRMFDAATLVAQDDKRAKPGSFRAPPPLPANLETHMSKGGADEEALVETARKWHAAIASKKEADALALFTEDVVIEDATQPRTFKGTADAKLFFASLLKTLPDAKVIATSFAADDLVASEGEDTLTAKVGGRVVKIHFVTVLAIKNGKIAKAWRYTSTKELQDQLHPPAPPPKKKP